MAGVEVLNEHERAACVGRKPPEQTGKRFEPAGGRTDPDDGRAIL